MIEIRSNRGVAFVFDAVKVGIYFVMIFYALKIVQEYIFKYISFMAMQGYTIDFAPLSFFISMANTLFEHFFSDFMIVLSFTLLYTLRNRYVFSQGNIYAYKGMVFVKERTVPYKNIKEIDYDKTFFDMGDIIIKLENEKPLKIPYISKVEEKFNIIRKETGFDADDKRIFEQVPEMGKRDRPANSGINSGN